MQHDERLSEDELNRCLGKPAKCRQAPWLQGRVAAGAQYVGDRQQDGFLLVVEWPGFQSVVSRADLVL